jgi:hypothetical protein
MVAGALLGIVAVVLVTLPLLQLVKQAPTVTTPGSVTLHLDKGVYKVFERTGTVLGGAADVSVVAPQIQGVIGVSDAGPTETITRNRSMYTSVVSFRVSTAGIYTVRIGGGPGEVIVSRSLADAVRGRVGWVATIPIGGLLFLIGLVMLVVGISRRSKARRTES